MPNPSITLEIGEVDGCHTPPGLADEAGQELMNYVSFRQGTYMNYSTNDDDIQVSREKMSRSAHYVQHELPTDTLRSRNSYQSILELATR